MDETFTAKSVTGTILLQRRAWKAPERRLNCHHTSAALHAAATCGAAACPGVESTDDAVNRTGVPVAEAALMQMWAIDATVGLRCDSFATAGLNPTCTSLGARSPRRELRDFAIHRAVVAVARELLHQRRARTTTEVGTDQRGPNHFHGTETARLAARTREAPLGDNAVNRARLALTIGRLDKRWAFLAVKQCFAGDAAGLRLATSTAGD